MFSEFGTIEGGRHFGNGEFSSEQLYGIRRYPDELRMMSQEVGAEGLRPISLGGLWSDMERNHGFQATTW